MATEVRESNNTALWVVMGLLALVAVIAIAWMATAGNRPDTVADAEPSTVIADIRDTSSDSAAAAARSAERAADAAENAARNVGDAATDATGRVTANIPAGDANIRVDAPVR